MKRRDLFNLLEENGWVLGRITGSHHIFVKEGHRPVPVPIHGAQEIPKGLVLKILKQAGIK